MNGTTTTTNSAARQNTEWCFGVKTGVAQMEGKKTEAKNLFEQTGLNFDLQPYKFITVNEQKQSEGFEVTRLQAFGRSFAGSLY